nr:putative UPF0481 protein At3g02645 [Tanacetum cinerariifolium]
GMDSRWVLEKGMVKEISEEIQRMGIGLLNRWPDGFKLSYMFDLFESLKSPSDDIRNECVRKVCSKFNQITACYGYNSDTITPKMSSEMCMIIVVDACYLLSVIHKWSQKSMDKLMSNLQTKLDLIVLDNQVPFFVLQDIFECTILKLDPTASLVELILSFLKDINPFEANSITGHHGTHETDYKHILDLLYKTYQPRDARSSDKLSTVTTTYSAVNLRKAGVKIKPYQGDKWKMDIKFNSSKGNTTLKMPAMRIEYKTTPVLWNLSAYERCFPEVGNYIASYIFAMMMLVDTKKDLLELVESKVIRTPSVRQFEVDMIHELCKGVVPKEFLFAKEWHALILFILTAAQT